MRNKKANDPQIHAGRSATAKKIILLLAVSALAALLYVLLPDANAIAQTGTT